MDNTKLGFPSISIVDDGAPADATSERRDSPEIRRQRDAARGRQQPHPRRHRRLRPGRSDGRDLRRAGEPRADRDRRLRARRPADDHQRRRELPRLPGGHPGSRADAEVPRAGGALRHAHRRRRPRPGRLLGPTVPALGGRRSSTPPTRSSSPPARRRCGWASTTRRACADAACQRLRDVRRLLLPRQEGRGRRRRRHGARGGDAS